jgi:hypothetical protein
MAKQKREIEEIAAKTIEAMRSDMIGTKYKLLNEVFVKAVASGGQISLEEKEFQNQRNSVLNADPDAPENKGKAVISMMGFEKGSQEKIKTLIAKGASKELFQGIESDTIALRKELTSKLSTEEGITELMSDLIIRKASEISPFQVRITKKEGMYEAGDTRMTNNTETAELAKSLTPGIILPKSVTGALITDINAISHIVAPIFLKHTTELFGQKESDGIVTLDKSKLTPENIEVFTKRVNNDLEKLPADEIIANSIVRDALKKLEKEGDYKISESQSQKIADKLSTALAKLDSEYLKQYASIISADIQKEILAKSTVTANIVGGVYIRESNLDRVADNLLEKRLAASDEYQVSIINDKLFGMKDSEIATKLSELSLEKANSSNYNMEIMSNQDLARIRKENPAQFDKVVFGKDTVVTNHEEVIKSVIDQAVDKLKKTNGIKLSPEKEIYLKGKFKKELTPALSKLDPEYLKEQSERISSEIQEELYKNKSIGYSFGQDFSVAKENLVKISDIITTKNQQISNQYEVSKVENLKSEGKQTNTELEQGLKELAVTKAKGAVFKAKDMDAEKLLEMRKQNPAIFDKIVLGVGKKQDPIVTSKEVSISTVLDKAKGISSQISSISPEHSNNRQPSSPHSQRGKPGIGIS